MSYATNCLVWIFSPTIRVPAVDQTIFPFGSARMKLPLIGPLKSAGTGYSVNSLFRVSNCNQRRLAPRSPIQIESPAPRVGGPMWFRMPTFLGPGGGSIWVKEYVFGSNLPSLYSLSWFTQATTRGSTVMS